MTVERQAGPRSARDLTSVVQTLAAEFPEVPVGRVLAQVVRCVKDLYRIAATRELPAPADEVLDVVTTVVRRRLRIFGVSEGTRTPDTRDHNPVL